MQQRVVAIAAEFAAAFAAALAVTNVAAFEVLHTAELAVALAGALAATFERLSVGV